MKENVYLKRLEFDDREQFILDNQEAFKFGAMEEFGLKDSHMEEDGEIISRKTIESTIDNPNSDTYRIMCGDKIVGGVIVLIDKKTRIKLRSLAMTIKPIIWVGKDGFAEKVLKQIEEELFNHELIKIAVQDNVEMPEEFELTEIAVKLGADVVTVIGRKVVLFKHSEKKNIKHVLEK